jgi:Lon protease-like protein
VVPSQSPFMVLPDCVLFPHALQPLFLFEERYRKMLAEVLEGDRLFGIVARRTAPQAGQEEIADIGCVGLVEACTVHEDGTANLLLRGLWRVRVEGWDPDSVFPLARVCPLVERGIDEEREVELCEEIEEALSRLVGKAVVPGVVVAACKAGVPASVMSHLIGAYVMGCLDERLALLAEDDVGKRVGRAVRYLRGMEG